MKKLLIGITVLAVLSMLGTTAMAGSSAPKSLCYQWEGAFPQAMMTLKSLGTIKTADGPVKHYAIHGTQLYVGLRRPSAITGTATFKDGMLRFTHTTIVRDTGEPGTTPTSWYFQLTTEGIFNTATGTGSVTGSSMLIPISGGAVTAEALLNLTISAVPCEEWSISTSATDTLSSSGVTKYALIPE